MIRIFVNLLPFYLQRSTDKDYARSLKNSAEKLDVSFYYPKRWMWGFWENVFLVINKLLSIVKCPYRIPIVCPKPYLNGEFNEKEFDVVYSQETCPRNAGRVPLFIESTFWLSGQNKPSTKADEDRFQSYTMGLFREYMSHPAIVNLKSDMEIENARKFFPAYKNRFVKVPFLLPLLHAATQKDVVVKHYDDKVLRIGFMGGQAVRKGLPELLAAYKEIKAFYGLSRRIEFHIISGYADGRVNIPKDLDIVQHGKLSYVEAQKVMRTWHLFAMISKYESYGLVYVEAMANGCINIVRDFYPQKEFVNDGQIGFLATPGNVESIVEALKNAISLTTEERIAMALAGLDKFSAEFAYPVVIEKFKAAIRDCADLGN